MLRRTIAEILIIFLTRLVGRSRPEPQASSFAGAGLYPPARAKEFEQLSAGLEERPGLGAPDDPWTRRARPTFLYVMYAMILGALPVGLIAAFHAEIAAAIAAGVAAYLRALPEPLYALFGTGYLGYATLRQWGKAKAQER
ncbi:3TM-type holin [Novosphingobium sp. M1R2S20]|uniref:3TM-type holin n=1 Tax=Novosphingobium rhizovicinum TaxID=3228928 RepID=A0ABV3RDB0_9SPHN